MGTHLKISDSLKEQSTTEVQDDEYVVVEEAACQPTDPMMQLNFDDELDTQPCDIVDVITSEEYIAVEKLDM